MEKSKELKPIPPAQLDHVKLMIVLVISFVLADYLTIFLTRAFPQLMISASLILQGLTYSVFFILMFLLMIRILSSILPELNISTPSARTLSIVVIVILGHSFNIAFIGSKILVDWIFLNSLLEGDAINAILGLILMVFGGFVAYQILSNSEVSHDGFHKYLKYIGNQILVILIIIITTIFLVRSFVSEEYESLTVTFPVKLGLAYLYFVATLPHDNQSDATEGKSD